MKYFYTILLFISAMTCIAQSYELDTLGFKINMSIEVNGNSTTAILTIKNITSSTVYISNANPNGTFMGPEYLLMDIANSGKCSDPLAFPYLELPLIELHQNEEMTIIKTKDSNAVETSILRFDYLHFNDVKGYKLKSKFKKSIRKNEPKIGILYYVNNPNVKVVKIKRTK